MASAVRVDASHLVVVLVEDEDATFRLVDLDQPHPRKDAAEGVNALKPGVMLRTPRVLQA